MMKKAVSTLPFAFWHPIDHPIDLGSRIRGTKKNIYPKSLCTCMYIHCTSRKDSVK